MAITNKLLKQVDLPVWEWMKFAPASTSSLSALASDKTGQGRYMYYYATNVLYRYDTWGDTWQQLSTNATMVAPTLDMEMVKNQGFRGNVLAVPTSTSLQIPSTGGSNLNGLRIRIVSGRGAGQERTIISSNPEVIADAGLTTTANGNVLTDSTKRWKYNQWVGYSARIIYGSGFSEFRQILYNDTSSVTVFDLNYDYKSFQMAAFSTTAPYGTPTATNTMFAIVSQVINIDSAWTVAPDTTSKFLVLSNGIWFITSNASTPFFSLWYYDILSDTFTQKLTPTNLITTSLGTDLTTTTTYDNNTIPLISSTATTATTITFTDSALTGITANDYSGLNIRITGGTGNGQSRRIYANTSNTFRLSKKWDTIPDATSTYIISNEDALYLEGNSRAQMMKYLPEPNMWANGNILDYGLTMNLGLIKTNPNNNIGVTSGTIASNSITAIASAPTAAGSGYLVGDVLTVSTGGSLGRVYVETINAVGGVLTVSLLTAGNTYTTGSGKSTTGGSGAGCTINITSVGSVGVITTSIPHDLIIGDSVTFTGATEAAWNTTYTILGIQSATVVEVAASGASTVAATYSLATTLLVDLTKNWTPNEHAGKLLGLQSNSLSGNLTYRRIVGNSVNTISFLAGVAPTNGNSRYYIQDLEALGKDVQYMPTQQQPTGFVTSGITGAFVDSTKTWQPNTYTNSIIRLVDTSSTNEIQDILTYNTTNTINIGRTIGLGSGTNTLGYSDDNGVTWTGNGSAIFSTQGNAAAWSGTRFVAAGSGTNALAWSNDGITWNGLGITTFSTAGAGIAWNGTRFVAVGSGTNTLAWSNDGTTWNNLGVSTFSTQGSAVVWNGTRWVAGGAGTNSLAYSTDGITWTANGVSIFSTSCLALSWNGTRVVAGGAGSTNSLAYSNDGITFTGNGKTIFSTQCNGIAWNGSIFVAVGQGTNSIAYSPDGINWTGVTSSTSIFSTGGNSVAWNGTRFVAGGTGTNSLAYSTDGITWTTNGIATFTTSCFGLASTSPFASMTPNIGLIPNTATTYTIYDVSGQATSTSLTTQLVDTNKKWKTNQWVNKKLLITSSTGVQQELLIVSNTTNTLTFALATAPDATSTYTILGRPAITTGLVLESNWGSSSTSKSRLLISNRGGSSHTFDTYDIRTNRWTYGDFILGQGETMTTGSMFCYDGGDRIYFQKDATGRMFYYDLIKKTIDSFGMIPYGMSTAILGNRMEIMTTADGLNYLYIMRHSSNEMWRTLIYY